MRRVQSLTLVVSIAALTGAVAVGDALAQQTPGQSRGLRYLSWSGRGEAAAPEAGEPPAPARADLRRPNRVIPHGGRPAAAEAAPAPRGLTPAPGGRRAALTPANAWMQPAAPPPPEPAPTAPVAPAPAAPRPTATPDYLPDQGGRGQAIPAEIAYPQPPAGPADPMAPRRDAPIFRMQQAPPQPAPTEPAPAPAAADRGAGRPDPQPRRIASVAANPDDRPAAQGARYYSVHRQNGREPDAVEIPQPTYVDALAVTIAETPASQDLAQPDRGPTLIRDAQGRVRAQPAAPEGDYE